MFYSFSIRPQEKWLYNLDRVKSERKCYTLSSILIFSPHLGNLKSPVCVCVFVDIDCLNCHINARWRKK